MTVVTPDTLLFASTALVGFLFTVGAYLPKGLDEEWFAYTLFLAPAPVLFLLTAILAAYGNGIALYFFAFSTVALILLFLGLGIWSAVEKLHENKAKDILRKRSPRLFSLLSS